MSIRINHFSDVLCIWAWISQVRVAELRTNFAEDVEFDYRYFGVFGDVATKMATQWRDRGALAGYAEHVHETAADFDHVTLHDDVWRTTAPSSSPNRPMFSPGTPTARSSNGSPSKFPTVR